MPTESRKRGRPKGSSDPNDTTTNQSLERTIDILACIAANPGMALSDITERLSLSPATVHRTLNTLEKRQLADHDLENQTWYIGPELFRLGSAFLQRSSLTERARPVMRSLMQATGETANLGIEREGQVIFVSQVESQSTIRALFQPGTRSPLYASGIGKALLCHYQLEQIDALYPDDQAFVTLTPNTLTDKLRLLAELEQIRLQGFAVDNEEKTEGMRCVAAAIIDHTGEAIGGLSVSGPVDRMPDERLTEIGQAVREAACELSSRLGAPHESIAHMLRPKQAQIATKTPCDD